MRYDEFVEVVAREAGVDREQAERAVRATLQTLAERIAQGEARDLASRLPPELAPWVATTTPAERFDVDEFMRRVAERFDVDEFMRRVAERAKTDVPAAERLARVVFDALARAIGPDELADVAAELSKDYAFLLPRGPYIEVLPADAFAQRVAERAGLDEDGARRAIEAVLQTLAERIAGGEVDDLRMRLPIELHEPLMRGREQSAGRATRMAVEDFLARVAAREQVGLAEARNHTAAVLSTLREAVGDEEFLDVTSQLPTEYDVVLAR
ncbi:MAG TPA: DUF2267 domain-containing protein [Solirubrobacteraceae bacterium]